MYCPKCGHQLINETLRYCSRCGLLLDGVTDFLSSNEARIQDEKRVLMGTRLAFSTILVSLIYLILLGAFTLLEILDKSTFRTVWIIYLLVAFGMGSFSTFYLARGGFFKKWSEREKRTENLQSSKKRKELEPVKESIQAATNPSLRLPVAVSVTETTTRNLEESFQSTNKKRESQ
jgi:hypothetical protein